MRKLMFAALLLLLVPGCSCEVSSGPPKSTFEVETIKYDGHNYLRFHYWGHNHDDPIVHDPDCPCGNKK